MNTKEVIDRIFKDPNTRYELTEFENLGKPIHEILSIFLKSAATGRSLQLPDNPLASPGRQGRWMKFETFITGQW